MKHDAEKDFQVFDRTTSLKEFIKQEGKCSKEDGIGSVCVCVWMNEF
jgi:hypothetical protein